MSSATEADFLDRERTFSRPRTNDRFARNEASTVDLAGWLVEPLGGCRHGRAAAAAAIGTTAAAAAAVGTAAAA